jgi:large subunit ribosomal protein L4
MKIDIYNQKGEKIGEQELDKNIFEVKAKPVLIHEALLRQLSNGRRPVARAKTKAERRGGGRKPYAQKGTGRARAGSRRSPVWRKGGVIFGPTGQENYQKSMPIKQRRKALFGTLTLKAQKKQLLGLDQYISKEIKTKNVEVMLKKLHLDRSVLIVVPKKNVMLQKSAGNIPTVKVILANYLNIADLMKFEKVLFLKEALLKLNQIFKA